jgi:hypothetical protein
METKETKNNTENKDNSSSPPLIQSSGKDLKEVSIQNRKNASPIFNNENILSGATIALFVATLFLAWANWMVAKDSKKQVEIATKMVRSTEDMVEATKKSIAISESSTVVAKKGLEIEQENMYASNTPYISISVPIANMNVAKGERLTGIVHYYNMGKTPALDFRSLPIVRMEGKYAPADTEKPINVKVSTGKPILMPQDFLNNAFTSHVLSETDAYYINNGIWTVYICSVVNYRDVFGHKFQVTQRLIWNGKSFYPDDYGNEYKKY